MHHEDDDLVPAKKVPTKEQFQSDGDGRKKNKARLNEPMCRGAHLKHPSTAAWHPTRFRSDVGSVNAMDFKIQIGISEHDRKRALAKAWNMSKGFS